MPSNLRAMACCGVKEFVNIQLFKKKSSPLELDCVAILKNHFAGSHFIQATWKPNPEYRGKRDLTHPSQLLVYNPELAETRVNMAHAVFTDAHITPFFRDAPGKRRVDLPYGKTFAKFILKNKLGTLVCTPNTRNPNSGNMVTAYLWTLDQEACKKWIKENIEPAKI